MSDQFDDEGFTRKSEQDILREKEELFGELFDTINYDPSDILWQWLKIQAIEREEIELLVETAMEQMSIQTAQGVFLEKWGEMLGIPKKGAQKAQGYVEVTTSISGSAVSIPEGTTFQSSTGKSFTLDIADEIPYEIEMTKTRTGESDDYFPSSVASIASVEEIVDANNNVIDSDYYTLNSEYGNHIEWESSSSAKLIKNESYTVRASGNVTKRIEVTSTDEGVSSNAKIGEVTTCVEFPDLTVTNEEEIDGGTEEESDESYRSRLLGVQNRNFTLNSIKNIVLGLDGVRSCRVYQNTGIDQTSVEEWDNPTLGTDINISGTTPLYSQKFVPGKWSNGDSIATLGQITLYGKADDDPPALVCGIKGNTDLTGLGNYYDYVSLEEYELDPSETGYQDLIFPLKYNGLDYTKTYRFDVWCEDPSSDGFDWSENHWDLRVSNEGYVRGDTDDRGMLYKIENGTLIAQGSGTDLMFKTQYNAAGFTIVVSTKDGYGFLGSGNVKDQIETYLDYVEEGGYSPVCIQSVIKQADEINIDIQSTIYITQLAEFDDVRRDLVDSLESYLEGIDIGENVVYARIWEIIMAHPQVTNLKNLKIKRSSSDEWKTTDIGILNDEVPDLGSTSFQSG